MKLRGKVVPILAIGAIILLCVQILKEIQVTPFQQITFDTTAIGLGLAILTLAYQIKQSQEQVELSSTRETKHKLDEIQKEIVEELGNKPQIRLEKIFRLLNTLEFHALTINEGYIQNDKMEKYFGTTTRQMVNEALTIPEVKKEYDKPEYFEELKKFMKN